MTNESVASISSLTVTVSPASRLRTVVDPVGIFATGMLRLPSTASSNIYATVLYFTSEVVSSIVSRDSALLLVLLICIPSNALGCVTDFKMRPSIGSKSFSAGLMRASSMSAGTTTGTPSATRSCIVSGLLSKIPLPSAST